MVMAQEMASLAREVIASYEARLAWVEQIIESTHEMLETFRSQREAIRAQLRETLARAASLRKRDFDAMMQGILARQEKRERVVKEAVRGYLQEQRALAASLKETMARGDAGEVETVKELLGRIAAGRQEREVKACWTEFQREQEELTRALQGLLSNGGSVRVREFKATLRAIEARRGEGGRDDGNPVRLLPGGGVRSL